MLSFVPFDIFIDTFDSEHYVRLFNISKEFRSKVCQHILSVKNKKDYMIYSASIGELNCMKWLKFINVPLDSDIFKAAAINNQTSVCDWLRINYCPWNENISMDVAARGHLNLLKWLYFHGYKLELLGIPNIAVEKGHLDVIKWADEIGIKCTMNNYYSAAHYGHLHILEWLFQRYENNIDIYQICRHAGLNGRFNVIDWIYKQGWICNEIEMIDFVVFGGNLDIVKLLHKKNPSIIRHICQYASTYGKLDIYQWAYENGGYIDERLYSTAASNGHLHMIKHFRQLDNDHPLWDEQTCMYAVIGGRLEVLKYLHENGCPWNKFCCVHATSRNNQEIVQYLHENGCPCNCPK